MHNSTLKSNFLHLCLTLLLFAVAAVAKAVDFGPAPTKFTTNSLNGTYDVKFVGCESDGLYVTLVNLSDYVLVDANGVKVPFSFVVPTMKDDFTVSFSIAGADEAPAGTYTLQVPTAAFCLSWMNNITSDAFDVTIDYNNGGGTDPDPVVPDVNPGDADDVATITLNDHKADASIYYRTGDVIGSNAKGVSLRFDRVGMDYEDYTTVFKSNSGYLQLRDCNFTITAPEGNGIMKIEFVDAAPNSTTYLIENIEASGCNEGVWTGYARSVSFKTAVASIPTYELQDVYNDMTGEYEEEEVIVGYSETPLPARVKTIYVTLDGPADKDHSAIVAINASDTTAAAPLYDLAGRRISSAAQKGVFIQGGKKTIR